MFGIFFLTPLLTAATLMFAGTVEPALSPSQLRAGPVSITEAQILIYLLPEAHQLRDEGMDVGWERQTNPRFNQEDFYIFWVINTKRPQVEGSVTIGFYAVNKHTADVWDMDLERYVTSAELEGVQRILHRAHRINETTIQKYRARRP